MDSPAEVTIRILPHGPTYSSDVKRLRKVRPESSGSAPPTHALDVPALQQKLAAKFSSALPISDARLNPHAAPGTPLHTRFAAAAVASRGAKEVDIMLHGSPEHNVDSILQSSLRGRTCWFTDDVGTAADYAYGAQRIIAFAVLRDKGHADDVYTTQDPAHHLPLFELPFAFDYGSDYY